MTLRPGRISKSFPILVAAAVSLALAPGAVATTGDITTVAGTGVAGSLGDGFAATLAQLHGPTGIAPLPDGSFLIADYTNNRIRKVASDGTITTVAGTGAATFGGDSGPATAAQLNQPVSVAVLSDGSFLIADSGNNRIRKVSSGGVITTVAGNGTVGSSGDNGAATSAKLSNPTDARPTADGGFLIADHDNNRVRKVSSGGTITTVAGTGTAGSLGDSGLATAAQLSAPVSVAALADGSFLIADSGNSRIRKVSSGGVITTVAGTGVAGFGGDGGPATAAQLHAPIGLEATPGGGFLFADMMNNRVRAVAADGTITTLAGTGTPGFSGEGGPATAADLSFPVAVATAANGAILIADTVNNRVRSIDTTPAPAPSLLSSESPTTSESTEPAATDPDPAPADAPAKERPTPLKRLTQIGLILPGGTVTVTPSGAVPIEIGCPADAGALCRGTITLEISARSARRASSARRGQNTLKVASTQFAVAPGKKATVKAKLSSRGRSMLAKKGSLKVTAKISRRGNPTLGQKEQTSTLIIKSPKRSRRA